MIQRLSQAVGILVGCAGGAWGVYFAREPREDREKTQNNTENKQAVTRVLTQNVSVKEIRERFEKKKEGTPEKEMKRTRSQTKRLDSDQFTKIKEIIRLEKQDKSSQTEIQEDNEDIEEESRKCQSRENLEHENQQLKKRLQEKDTSVKTLTKEIDKINEKLQGKEKELQQTRKELERLKFKPSADNEDEARSSKRMKPNKYCVNMVKAPPQVSEVQQELKAELWSLAEGRDIRLDDSEEAPALVTIINSSRVGSDIRRDLGRVQDLRTERIMLLIIKSTNDPTNPLPKVSFQEDMRVQAIRFLLVDRSYRQLLHCQYNSLTMEAIMQFLASNN